MPTTIKLKRSFSAGAEPSPSDLVEGEIAVNAVDGKLWTKDNLGNVVLLGGLQDGSTLPLSDPGVDGELWNDSGTVRISNG